MHVFYKLNFKDGYYYYGITNNMQRRLNEHKQDKKEYGFESHEILKEFENEVDAYRYEKSFITFDLIKDEYCLNQTTGGRYPNNRQSERPHSPETLEKIKKTRALNPYIQTEEQRGKSRQLFLTNNPAKRPEVRKILSDQKLGENNPQFGKIGTMSGVKHTEVALTKMSIIVDTPAGIFPSSTKAAEANNCCQQSVMDRCYSESEKFKDWKIVSIGSGIAKKLK